MEYTKLSESLNVLGYSGICINMEKANILQNSLMILQQDNHFRKTFYWGRINGSRNDYHIAYGYEKDCLVGKKYFYSIDCMDWLLMPKPNKCGRFLTPLATTAFDGDPSTITNVFDANPDEDSAKFFSIIPKELKEEDRLSTTVDIINEDAMIIPRGGWFKRPSGEIIENLSFEGLTISESIDQKSYLHARLPQQKWNTNLLNRTDYNYAVDFLDSIDMDVPKACWNIKLHQGENLAIIRNFYWPGMIFYHRVNSPHYGSLYVGNGNKILDVPFMI